MNKYISLKSPPLYVNFNLISNLPKKSFSHQTPFLQKPIDLFHMLNHLVCGTFDHQEDDVLPCSSPRKAKRKESRNNNPYSSRGLDKFSTLLADLDQRRKKVYSQMNPHDISFVRFAYSNTDDFVPIVVKVKNNKDQKKHKSEELKVRHLTSFSEPMDQKPVEEERKQPKLESHDDHKKAVKIDSNMLKRPSFYVPVVIILILVFLTVFGRSVATLCTCVMWYIVPLLKDSWKPDGKLMKKKDYVRGLSEKKMVNNEGLLHSPRRGDSGASNNNKSSGKHSHQNSW